MIINEHRREFIAKLISDLGKTIFAVGLASYFFEKFPISVKIGLWLVFATSIFVSIFIYPNQIKGGR